MKTIFNSDQGNILSSIFWATLYLSHWLLVLYGWPLAVAVASLCSRLGYKLTNDRQPEAEASISISSRNGIRSRTQHKGLRIALMLLLASGAFRVRPFRCCCTAGERASAGSSSNRRMRTTSWPHRARRRLSRAPRLLCSRRGMSARGK